jgi:hypothetical protein
MSQTPNTAIAVIGIDIGKNSFHVVGHDARGAIVLRQKWSRGQVEAQGPRTGSGVYCCGRRVGRSDSDLLYGFRAGNGSPTPRDYDGYSRVG